MDTKAYFKLHQKELLRLANTESGRFLLSTLIGEVSSHRIDHITPNSFRQDLNQFEFKGKQLRKVYKSTFTSRRPFADILIPIIEKIRIAQKEWKKIEINSKTFEHFSGLNPANDYPQIFLNSSTFNPASGANDPVDGSLQRGIVDESFNSIVTGAGQTANVINASQDCPECTTSSTSGNFRQMTRGVYTFATGTLGSSAIISAATFSIYGNGSTNQLGDSPNFNVVTVTTATTNNLSTSDYAYTNFGTTLLATAIALGSWNTAGYNDSVLNTSGIANINLTKDSQFGTRTSWDVNNNFTGTWGSLSDVRFNGYFADNGTNIPKLVVTYTLPASGGSFLLNFV